MIFKFSLVVVACFVTLVWAEEKYTTKFDNVNLDDILANDRLLQNYVKCLKGSGKCTPDGAELKRVLPDALETGCKKCSEKQKEGAEKVIRHLVNKRPNIWNELKGIYDPTGKFTEKYKDQFEKVVKN